MKYPLAQWMADFNAGDAEKICDLFALDLRYDYRGQPERRYGDICALLHRSLADGTKLTERVEAVRGTAQNPMTRDEVVSKARDLMSPALGASKSAKLIQAILALETVNDIRELRPLLQRG